MKPTKPIFHVGIPLVGLLLCGITHAATVFDPDTFSDGTVGGWGGGDSLTNQLGGPAGASDRFMQCQSFGGSFAGSKMAYYNESPKFTGNFTVAGVTGASVYFKNLSGANLSMRLVLMDSLGSEWTSTTAQTVTANSNWALYTFPINATVLTRVTGTATFANSQANVSRFMFRHQTGSPSTNGTAIAALMGVDNVQLTAPTQVISGSLQLSNTGPFALNRTMTYSVKQGTITLGSGSITASAPTSPFAITLLGSYTGAATLTWDGSSFLVRKANINLTGSNLSVGSISMQNGDVDHSGEVDAADIDAVIANFGTLYPGGPTPDADVDVSGEVDAADIDIVIANFGGIDD